MKKRVFKRVFATVACFVTMQIFADCVQEERNPQEEPQSAANVGVLQHRLYKVDNTDFELFLTAIVDAASQTGKQALLSKALLSCFDYLSDNQKVEYLERIEMELPALIEHVQLYKTGRDASHTR